MRTFTILFLFFALPYLLSAQQSAASQWQEDLRFLQKTVHDEYPFLFKKVKAEAFDAAVEELYQAIPSLEEHEIIVELARLVALFEYGHTILPLSGWYDRGAFHFHQAPFNLYAFSDGIYVQGVHKDYEKALGAKVLKVEGMPADEALAAIRPVVSAENDQYFKAYGINYLGIPEVLHARKITAELKETLTLTLEKEGKVFDIAFSPIIADQFPGSYGFIRNEGDWLDARDQTATPLFLKNLDRIYYFEYLPAYKTVYVRQSQIQDDEQESIPDFCDRVFQFIEENEVEKLVWDVRLNGGGNNYKNRPVVKSIIRTKKIDQAGRLFVITGRRTFSACQNLVNELDNYTEAIFVGEPTAENINFYGDNNQVVLPNSQVKLYLSFAWWQDKPQWENGPWTPPHLAVDMSFADYRSNRDPILQAALEFADSNFILDPIDHLTALYMAGKLEEVTSEAKRLVSNPSYRYYDFETRFNDIGYRIMGQGQLQEAYFVFELNAELFPLSANARDSLGEVCWKMGQREKALQHYRRAIELDPDGWVGDNARKMVKKIEAEEK